MTQDCQCLFPGSPALWVLNKLSGPAPPGFLPAPRVLPVVPLRLPAGPPAPGPGLSPLAEPQAALKPWVEPLLQPMSPACACPQTTQQQAQSGGVHARGLGGGQESQSKREPEQVPTSQRAGTGTRHMGQVICHSSALRMFLHLPSWGLSLGWSGGWV